MSDISLWWEEKWSAQMVKITADSEPSARTCGFTLFQQNVAEGGPKGNKTDFWISFRFLVLKEVLVRGYTGEEAPRVGWRRPQQARFPGQ